MTSFTMIVILGVLMIIGGISMLSTPLANFLSLGYYIIILFFIWGITGIVQGISAKRYDKRFLFAILSVILGIAGLVIPGAVEVNNTIMLYMAGGWFVLRGVLSILDALAKLDVHLGTVRIRPPQAEVGVAHRPHHLTFIIIERQAYPAVVAPVVTIIDHRHVDNDF